MQFLVYFEVEPDRRDEGYERFKAIGTGAPDDVKILGMWIAATLLEGWCIVEADDAVSLGEYLKHWTDLNVNHVTPVLSMDEIHTLMS